MPRELSGTFGWRSRSPWAPLGGRAPRTYDLRRAADRSQPRVPARRSPGEVGACHMASRDAAPFV